jgi:hypothetical protein
MLLVEIQGNVNALKMRAKPHFHRMIRTVTERSGFLRVRFYEGREVHLRDLMGGCAGLLRTPLARCLRNSGQN